MINKNDLRKAISSIAISNAKRNTIYKAFSNLGSITKEEFDSVKSDISKVVESMLTKDTVGKANGVASLDSNGSVPIEQLGNIDTTLFLIVRELPTTNIKTNKIYLIPSKDAQGNNIYVEYLYVENVWENLGEFKAEVDLSEYLNKLSTEIIYDVSARNDGAVFESLQALLSSSNLSTLIPTSVRHGGMSIRFVQSSDNRYVQYRLIANTFSTTVTDWQGVDDLSLKNSEDDLELADENGNVLMILSRGNIKTKNFNSETDVPFNSSSSLVDFEISDEQENILFQIIGGNIKTKYFDSSAFTNNEWAGKKLSILGDSISTFGVPDQNNAIGTWTYAGNRCRYPQSDLFTNVEYQYWYKLIQKLGMTLGINESWAGSRVSNTQATDSGDLGPNRCMASLTRIGHLGENGTPNLIIVYGGTNDAGASVTLGTFDTTNPKNYTEEEIANLQVDTFANAYRTMLVRLQYYYPLAKIICCFPNYTDSYYTITNLDKYEEIIREACDFFGIEYIDLRTIGVNVYNTSTYLPDGIHPNANGMELIYKIILKKII